MISNGFATISVKKVTEMQVWYGFLTKCSRILCLISPFAQNINRIQEIQRNVISEASSKKLQLVSNVKDSMISNGFVWNLIINDFKDS